MTKVNIRTVSYNEWQKRMFKALKDLGVEQWTRAKEFLGIISERAWNSDFGKDMDWRALR